MRTSKMWPTLLTFAAVILACDPVSAHDIRRVTANAARRMQSLVPRWPDTRFALFDEVVFYLSFLQFLSRANSEVARRNEDQAMPIGPWKELLERVEGSPVAELDRKSVV